MSLTESQFGRIFTTLVNNAATSSVHSGGNDARPATPPTFLAPFSGVPAKRPRLSSTPVRASVERGKAGLVGVTIKTLRPPHFSLVIEQCPATTTIGDVKVRLWQALADEPNYDLPGGATGVKLLHKGRVLQDGVALSALASTGDIVLHAMMPSSFASGETTKEVRVLPSVSMCNETDDKRAAVDDGELASAAKTESTPSAVDPKDTAFDELARLANKHDLAKLYAISTLDGTTLRRIFEAGLTQSSSLA